MITASSLSVRNDPVLLTFINEEKPRLIRILRNLGVNFNGQTIIDVGAEIGLSAQVFKELGNENTKVIGYEVNPAYCSNRLNVFSEYYCREMTIDEYLRYVGNGFFIKMDCEGCEVKYLTVKLPKRGLLCLHEWIPERRMLDYALIDNDWVPIFHAFDWREICFMKISL